MELKPLGGFLVGLAIFAIAVGGFCIYEAFGASWHPWLVAAIADAIAVPIVALAWWTHRRRGLSIDNAGITEHTGFGEVRVEWDAVSHYFYSSAIEEGWLQLAKLHAPAAIALRLVPHKHIEYGRLAVVGKDGATVRLYGQRWRETASALQLAFNVLHARLREHADYAPFVLTAAELSCGSQTIPLAEIARASCGRARIRIYRIGQRLAWAAVPVSRVRNSLLFVEELRSYGIDVKIDLNASLPPLRSDVTRARPAALPVAKTVAR